MNPNSAIPYGHQAPYPGQQQGYAAQQPVYGQQQGYPGQQQGQGYPAHGQQVYGQHGGAPASAPVQQMTQQPQPLKDPSGPPPYQNPNWDASQASGQVGAPGSELPPGSKVTSRRHRGPAWEIHGFNRKTGNYVLKCTKGQRPNVEANIYDLTPVPTAPGFKAIFQKPLPEGEVLIHLFGDGGMSVADARSLLGGNCGLQPEKLIIEMNQGRNMARLQDNHMIYQDQTVYVRMSGGVAEAETSQTTDMIPVKVPSEGVGCIAGCQENMHCKNLWLTMFIWGLISAIIYLVAVEGMGFGSVYESYDEDPWNAVPEEGSLNYLSMCLIAAGVLYLLYLIESCFSSTCKYLNNIETKDGVHKMVDRLQRTAPQIIWKINCYHYETRTRYVSESYTDQNGNRQTRQRLETYTVRIDTHSARQHYRFDAWDDVSGQLPSLTDYKLTKLTIGKQWMFADAFTEADYSQRKEWFITFNDRDVHFDFSTKLHIPGHREKILAEVEPGSTPCFLSMFWFWFMNLITMSLPFRWYFTSISGRRDFNLIKRIQKSVPIMQTWILPTMTVLSPFQLVQPPQQPGMVYNNNTTVNVNVEGAPAGANITVNVNNGQGASAPPVYR